ncbi:MAG TPA: hypothetical protein VK745_12130 [Polyangiaceae bacterium]|nr:hypothetical protein [Polyangiaceae bacterium]
MKLRLLVFWFVSDFGQSFALSFEEPRGKLSIAQPTPPPTGNEANKEGRDGHHADRE